MKNFIIFFSLLILCLATQAQTITAPPATPISVKGDGENLEIVKRPTGIIEDSSEHHRVGKKYQIAWQILGLGPNAALTRGLYLGKFLDRSSMIYLDVLGQNYQAYFSDTELDFGSIGLHYKKFHSNSFYYVLGGDYRSVKYEINDPLPYSAGSFKSTSWVFSASIGNQWQWENFTLGCDWVGTSVVLSHQYSEEDKDSLDIYDRTDFENDKEWFTERNTLHLLRFYLGYSF